MAIHRVISRASALRWPTARSSSTFIGWGHDSAIAHRSVATAMAVWTESDRLQEVRERLTASDRQSGQRVTRVSSMLRRRGDEVLESTARRSSVEARERASGDSSHPFLARPRLRNYSQAVCRSARTSIAWSSAVRGGTTVSRTPRLRQIELMVERRSPEQEKG